MFSRFTTCAIALALALCWLPATSVAGAIFKCVGADGRTSFSDAPCATSDSQHTVKATPARGEASTDIQGACDAASRRPLSSRVIEACMFMRECEKTGNAQACIVYCRDFPDTLLPGIKFGVASPACLAHTKRVRGRNWVQSAERERAAPYKRQPHETLRYECLDATGLPSRAGKWVLCEPGTTSCTSPETKNGDLAPYEPLDGLLTKTCQRVSGRAG